MKNIYLIYYSPALSTRKTVRAIGREMGVPTQEYDITQGLNSTLTFNSDDLVIFGVPVFSGRVPALATEALQNIKGNNTPAIITCTYGNREYEDTLLELRNICEERGFQPFAGAAFISRHSIFPRVAANRPDEEDTLAITKFAEECGREYKKLRQYDYKQLTVKGSYPYRVPSAIPLYPSGNSTCDKCGICVKLCPVGAIPEDRPRKTNKKLCVSCARCVAVCPQHSRSFRSLLYRIVRRKFESSYVNNRKEVETFFIDR